MNSGFIEKENPGFNAIFDEICQLSTIKLFAVAKQMDSIQQIYDDAECDQIRSSFKALR